MTDGPYAEAAEQLGGFYLVRTDSELLVRAGRTREASVEFERAIARCDNEVERLHLVRRRVETTGG